MININVTPSRSNFVKRDERLMEVYVLDYGDNYHRDENAPTTEFEKEVRKIKARYRDINKYNYAKALYKEYIQYLAEKHGGMDLFKLKKKHGLIDDYIPPKPRIKNTKELKFLKKNKIVIGNVGRYLIDDDKLDEYIEDNYNIDTDGNDIINRQYKDKTVEDILDDSTPRKMKNVKSQSFKSDFDFLDNYFRNKNYNPKKKNKKGKKKKNKDNNTVMIKDLMRSDYDQYYYGKDEYMEDSDNGFAVYNNLMLSTGTVKELDVYHKLNDIGWNSYKIMKRGPYSKRVASVFKPPKKKKKKKKSAYSGKYDGLLIDIMSDNGFDTDDMDSFAEFQKEMLNMTSENVFR